MPNLSKEDQRTLGQRVLAQVEALPADERLVVLIAVVYGEGRNQGLSGNAVTALFAKLVRIHEQGMSGLVMAPLPKCPTCGRSFGGES